MAKQLFIVGIDEVGRGPLAGPLVVGAVAMPLNVFSRHRTILRGIKDSKRLTPTQREQWYARLIGNTTMIWSTASVSHNIIDAKGIRKAATIAVALSLKRLQRKNENKFGFKMVYLDGSLYAPPHLPQKTIIKGDEKMPIIAAASIIAKVTRDRLMVRYAQQLPQYGFENHKGYGTYAHYAALKKFGPSTLHRRTFLSD